MQAYGQTIGRRHEDSEDYLLSHNPFLNDFTKVLQSKGIRRLAHKTQVLCAPDHSHIRTRLTHTQEVISLSAYISENLGLNTYLCMAIAAAHDIGHAPYGHAGEGILTKFGGKPFKHYINSVVLAQHIERKGKGLNLTYETLEGAMLHSRGYGELYVNQEDPQEYSIGMFSDKIAYVFSDINDAVRYEKLEEYKRKEILELASEFGHNQRTRNNTVIEALLEESREKGYVQFRDSEIAEKFMRLKNILENDFYKKLDDKTQRENLEKICEFFATHSHFADVDPVLAASLLTDKEANRFVELRLVSRTPRIRDIDHFGLFEILPYIKGRKIDYTDPDLGWGDELKKATCKS